MAALRTTIRLDERLMEAAKREAARRGETFTALVEEGLRAVMSSSREAPRKRITLPVSCAGGGTFPGVDLNDSADLLDRMEGRR